MVRGLRDKRENYVLRFTFHAFHLILNQSFKVDNSCEIVYIFLEQLLED